MHAFFLLCSPSIDQLSKSRCRSRSFSHRRIELLTQSTPIKAVDDVIGEVMDSLMIHGWGHQPVTTSRQQQTADLMSVTALYRCCLSSSSEKSIFTQYCVYCDCFWNDSFPKWHLWIGADFHRFSWFKSLLSFRSFAPFIYLSVPLFPVTQCLFPFPVPFFSASWTNG